MNLKKYLKVAIKAAELGYNSILKEKKHIDIKENSKRDVKLFSDVESEKAIINYLTKKTNFSILSEEIGLIEKNTQFIWIIDPLDGSLNYSRDIPLNCISISLWKENSPIIGVIYDFNNNDFYTSCINDGSRLNKNVIRTNNLNKISDAILCTGFPVGLNFDDLTLSNFISDIKKYKKVRLLGSAGLSLSYLASGKVDVYYEKNIKIWDVAAGIAIVIGAGGYVKYSNYNSKFELDVYAACSKF